MSGWLHVFYGFCGIFLFSYGLLSLFAPFRKKEPTHGLETDDYLLRKILGPKQLNTFKNIFFGLMALLLGLFITLRHFNQLFK